VTGAVKHSFLEIQLFETPYQLLVLRTFKWNTIRWYGGQGVRDGPLHCPDCDTRGYKRKERVFPQASQDTLLAFLTLRCGK